MKKTFDQKWGLRILIAVITFIALYSYVPVVFGEWKEFYKTMDDSSGDKYKDNGQNLYYYVYDKVKVGPATAALEATAIYFGYGTNNLDYVISIVDGNTDGSALGADPMTVFDAEVSEYEETEDLNTIQGRYDKSMVMKTYFYDILADESFRSELDIQTVTNEMYANGDTSDSGFDIITDLKTIEYILFTSVTDTWTGDDGGDSGADGATDEGADSGLQSEDASGDFADESTEATDSDTTDSETNTKSADESGEELSGEISESELECFDDNTLSEAIDDFQASSSVASESDTSSSESSGEGSGEGATEDSTDDNSNGEQLTAEDDFYDSLEGPEAADWSRDLPCDDILCLEINFVTGDDEDYPYQETDNCIACHISFIKQTLEEVTSHDLSPSKLTGSMMEDATCKSSFSALIPSFGVFVITNPILTPPNDDIVVSVGNIIQNLKEALYPDTTTGATASDYSSLTDKYTALVQNTYGNASLVNNTDEILALTTQELEAQIEALTEYSIATQLSHMNTMYQAFSYEMAQMNSFFTAIELLLLDAQLYLDLISNKDYVE